MPKAKITRVELPKAKLLKFNSRGKAVSFTPPVLDEVDQEFGWIRDCWSLLMGCDQAIRGRGIERPRGAQRRHGNLAVTV